MNKTAFITGANRGIGLAISKALYAKGINLILGVRNLDYKEDLMSHFDGSQSVEVVKVDLNDFSTIDNLIKDHGEKIDILINNAGILFPNDKLLGNKEAFYESMKVMFEAPYELIHGLAPLMNKKNFGRIVNITSGWGSFAEGLEGPHAYGTAKAALNALTKAISRELEDNVKINSMCPGWVKTRMGGEMAPRTPEFGAQMAVILSTLDESGPSGKFFRLSDDEKVTEIPW